MLVVKKQRNYYLKEKWTVQQVDFNDSVFFYEKEFKVAEKYNNKGENIK